MSRLRKANLAAAKLTPQQVMEIRRRYNEGETQSSLCRAFQISLIQVGRIVRGESWQTLPRCEPSDVEIAASQAKLAALLGQDPSPPSSIVERMVSAAQTEHDRLRMNEERRASIAAKGEELLNQLTETKDDNANGH